jgi:hypothetical protein
MRIGRLTATLATLAGALVVALLAGGGAAAASAMMHY